MGASPGRNVAADRGKDRGEERRARSSLPGGRRGTWEACEGIVRVRIVVWRPASVILEVAAGDEGVETEVADVARRVLEASVVHEEAEVVLEQEVAAQHWTHPRRSCAGGLA